MVSESVVALVGLAAACLDAGEMAEAASTLAHAAEAAGEVGEVGVRASVLEQRARLALAEGQQAEAAALLAEASSLREPLFAHAPRWRTATSRRQRSLASERTAPGKRDPGRSAPMQRLDPSGSAQEIMLSVPAMTCRHCVRAISVQVRDVPGVVAVEADLTTRTVRVQGTPQPDALLSAIADAGYEAVG